MTANRTPSPRVYVGPVGAFVASAEQSDQEYLDRKQMASAILSAMKQHFGITDPGTDVGAEYVMRYCYRAGIEDGRAIGREEALRSTSSGELINESNDSAGNVGTRFGAGATQSNGPESGHIRSEATAPSGAGHGEDGSAETTSPASLNICCSGPVFCSECLWRGGKRLWETTHGAGRPFEKETPAMQSRYAHHVFNIVHAMTEPTR